MNHPKDRSKVEIASGAAIRAFQTAVRREKLRTDEVKQGKGRVLPQGARPAASRTSAALRDGCGGNGSGWLRDFWDEGSSQERSPGRGSSSVSQGGTAAR